jgi:hypothetical protein
MIQDHFRAFWMPLTVAVLFLALGCDNTFDPFNEDSREFSINGTITLSEDRDFIRIKDLKNPLNQDSTRVLDATVTLTNERTGDTLPLRDSVVVFDGVFTHNFWTDRPIQPGAKYQLVVERPDGRASWVSATMPKRTILNVDPAKDSVGCANGIVLNFENVPRARLLEISVGVKWNEEWRWVDEDIPTTFGFLPASIVESAVPDFVLEEFEDEEFFCTVLDDDTIQVAFTHFGPDWPADSVIADPTASNVENGLGIFGGLERDTLSKTILPPG